ncbi:MAG TPA: DinB family protein [Bryobacteraceae bacterium]|nr:DinB family protein [Bryobacteraceae bacterium]
MRRLLVLTFFANGLFAQNTPIPKSIAGSVARQLSFVEEELLSIAQAMPDAKYSFIPTAGKFDDARSFGEQIKHVACSQFAFFNEMEGKTPPAACWKGGPSKAATKAELIQYLRESFDYGNQVLGMVNQDPLARVEGPYAGPSTRLAMAVTAVWHITDHYGQLVEYLRMNGIVPPRTQEHSLQVR